MTTILSASKGATIDWKIHNNSCRAVENVKWGLGPLVLDCIASIGPQQTIVEQSEFLGDHEFSSEFIVRYRFLGSPEQHEYTWRYVLDSEDVVLTGFVVTILTPTGSGGQCCINFYNEDQLITTHRWDDASSSQRSTPTLSPVFV